MQWNRTNPNEPLSLRHGLVAYGKFMLPLLVFALLLILVMLAYETVQKSYSSLAIGHYSFDILLAFLSPIIILRR